MILFLVLGSFLLDFFIIHPLPLVLLRLHCGERQHLTDAPVIRQEHDHAVNTHTETTSRRKAVLEGAAECLVDELSLVITLILLAGLLLEAEALLSGNVQLGVAAIVSN